MDTTVRIHESVASNREFDLKQQTGMRGMARTYGATLPTFYTVHISTDAATPKNEFMETAVPETIDDVIAIVEEWDECFGHYEVVAIFRHSSDKPREDVTEKIAERIYEKWVAAGNDPQFDIVPKFVWRHAPDRLDIGYRRVK